MVNLRELLVRGMLAFPMATVPSWPTMCSPPVRSYQETDSKYEKLECIALQALSDFANRNPEEYIAKTRDPFRDGSRFVEYARKDRNEKPVDVITNAQNSITQIRLPYNKFGTDVSQGGVDLEILTVEISTGPGFKWITVRAENNHGFRIMNQKGKVRKEYFKITPNGTETIAERPGDEKYMADVLEKVSGFLEKFPQSPKTN